ncbi:unnamed protein product [Adineta steineri]|uniref:Uncharacterized protein n=1 Tax=Adineta steineri TaxID=433720 RepID=A0A819R1F7_9BILA|nr:unnamed protein product [Adineta steineri]
MKIACGIIVLMLVLQMTQKQGVSSDKFYCVEIDYLKGDQSDVYRELFDVIICVQAYHHFEDPTHIINIFAHRLWR